MEDWSYFADISSPPRNCNNMKHLLWSQLSIWWNTELESVLGTFFKSVLWTCWQSLQSTKNVLFFTFKESLCYMNFCNWTYIRKLKKCKIISSLCPRQLIFYFVVVIITMEKLISARKRELIIRTRRKIKVVVTRGKNDFKNWGLFFLFLCLLSLLSLRLISISNWKERKWRKFMVYKDKMFLYFFLNFTAIFETMDYWITKGNWALQCYH